jgi:exopolysaccharide biosynthesis protein
MPTSKDIGISPGTYSLELLIERDPDLLAVMTNARQSIHGLREVAKRVNAVVPGLYQEMQKIEMHTKVDKALSSLA